MKSSFDGGGITVRGATRGEVYERDQREGKNIFFIFQEFQEQKVPLNHALSLIQMFQNCTWDVLQWLKGWRSLGLEVEGIV